MRWGAVQRIPAPRNRKSARICWPFGCKGADALPQNRFHTNLRPAPGPTRRLLAVGLDDQEPGDVVPDIADAARPGALGLAHRPAAVFHRASEGTIGVSTLQSRAFAGQIEDTFVPKELAQIPAHVGHGGGSR